MRSVVVFKWAGGLPDDGDDPEQLTAELSRPAAEAILTTLRNQGCETNVAIPYAGEGGWHFKAFINGQAYSVFTLWTGIGDTSENIFAVQSSLQRGCLGAMFVRRLPDDKLEPLCKALDYTLKSLPLITDIRWLTDAEFRAAYCDGKPLPKTGGV